MQVCVVGAGAIGALVSGYLSKAGVEVTLVGRDRDIAAIGAGGLVIGGVRGEMTVPVRVKNEPEKGAGLVVLAVKTQDMAVTLSENAGALKESQVLTVQNGVRAGELLTEFVPPERMVSSIVMFGATYLEPGRVTHNFEGDWIIGRPDGSRDRGITEIGDTLGKAFNVHVTESIRGMKWLKLFLNMNNCLPALVGKSMQETFASLSMCRIAMRLWREALEVTGRAGIEPASLPDFPVARLRKLAGMPLDEASKIYGGIMTGLSKEPLYGSILQSIKRGCPSEIDYLNGEIVRLGDEVGEPAGLNKRVVEMVHEVEKNGEFLSMERVQDRLGGNDD